MNIGIVSLPCSSARRQTSTAKAVFLARVDTANPRGWGLSARVLRDAALIEKMWHVLQRQGIDIGREHTAQLMRSAGLSGKAKEEHL
nr:hypothetical protein FRC0402_01945 [Corynebacterium diphtheriae]